VPPANGALRSAQVVYSDHPNGFAHTQASIRKAAALAQEGSHSFPIVALARRIVHDVPGKAYERELQALYIWVREHVRYRKDPFGLEWLQKPERTVSERAGDCDDMAILLAALAGALGHQWRFVTVGPASGSQRHIAAQVSADGVAWVTLDPVLEPVRPSTELRTDAGAFGRVPPGASTRHWNQRGEPMSGLGFYPDAQLRELWVWQPYFPMGPFAPLVRPGAPNRAYESGDAPGMVMSGLGCSGPVQLSGSQVRRAVNTGCCGLGDGRQLLFIDSGSVNTAQRFDQLGGYPYQLGSIWGSIKKIGKAVGKVASGAVRTVGKVAKVITKSPIGKAALPVLALNVDPKLKKLRDAGLKALPIPQAQMLLKAGKAGEALAAKAGRLVPKAAPRAAVKLPGAARKAIAIAKALPKKPVLVRRPAAPAIARKRLVAAPTRPTDAWKKPHPALARKYGRGAQQLFDRKAGVFRVYVPRSSAATVNMSGVGALAPSLTLTLGATIVAGDSPLARMAGAAAAAIAAVQKFIKSRADKRPPGKALPEVLAFQQLDASRGGAGVLKTDGLWGNNTRAAAAYYTGQAVGSLPPNLPALNAAMTWSPPTTVVTRDGARPAPASPPGVPQPSPPPPPASSSSAPPGMVEIGTEKNNPGLPPVGAPSSSSSSSSSSSASVPVITATDDVVPSAPMRQSPPMLPPSTPGGIPNLTVTDDVPPLPADSVTRLPPPAPAPVAVGKDGKPIELDVYPPQRAPAPPAAPVQAGPPSLPMPPMPAGPGFPAGPVVPSEAGSGGDGSWVPWAVALYCLSKRRAA
jgi:Transglutaminase-like superfamily